MPRYEEMDDLLQRVRNRFAERPADAEQSREMGRPSVDVLKADGQYEGAVACMQALVRDAESLRDLLSSEHAQSLGSKQHEHLLSLLNSVLQELWSSEVLLRRAALE
ncbi:MAG TPA: hypothetical protein VF221_22925 [Chloroflexota bacterium]